MGGSASAPKASDEQKQLEDLQKQLLEEQLAAAKKPAEKIKLPKPLPPPPPPPQVSTDTEAAAEAARQAAARRTNTARKTLFAGETGGYQPKTLLG